MVAEYPLLVVVVFFIEIRLSSVCNEKHIFPFLRIEITQPQHKPPIGVRQSPNKGFKGFLLCVPLRYEGIYLTSQIGNSGDGIGHSVMLEAGAFRHP